MASDLMNSIKDLVMQDAGMTVSFSRLSDDEGLYGLLFQVACPDDKGVEYHSTAWIPPNNVTANDGNEMEKMICRSLDIFTRACREGHKACLFADRD